MATRDPYPGDRPAEVPFDVVATAMEVVRLIGRDVSTSVGPAYNATLVRTCADTAVRCEAVVDAGIVEGFYGRPDREAVLAKVAVVVAHVFAEEVSHPSFEITGPDGAGPDALEIHKWAAQRATRAFVRSFRTGWALIEDDAESRRRIAEEAAGAPATEGGLDTLAMAARAPGPGT